MGAFDDLVPTRGAFDDLIPKEASNTASPFDDLIPKPPALPPELSSFANPLANIPRNGMERAEQNFQAEQSARPAMSALPPGEPSLEDNRDTLQRIEDSIRNSRIGRNVLGNPGAVAGSELERKGISALLGVPAKVANTAGRAAEATLGDIAAKLRNDKSAEGNFGGNLKELVAGRGETELPVEHAMKLSALADKENGDFGWGTLAGDISLGLADLAPKIAMLQGAPGGLLSQSAASADIFGFDDKGNFNPKNAAFAAAFPVVTQAASAVTDKVIQKAVDGGLEWAGKPAAQRALHVAVNQAAMNTVMGIQNEPELMHLSKTEPDEFKRRVASMIGGNLAFAIPEAMKDFTPIQRGEAERRSGQPEGKENNEQIQTTGEQAGATSGSDQSGGTGGGDRTEEIRSAAVPGDEPGGTAKAGDEQSLPQTLTPDLAAELQAAMRGNQVKEPAQKIAEQLTRDELAQKAMEAQAEEDARERAKDEAALSDQNRIEAALNKMREEAEVQVVDKGAKVGGVNESDEAALSSQQSSPPGSEVPGPATFKRGDKVLHDGIVKTVSRVSPDGKFVVLGKRAVPVREISPLTETITGQNERTDSELPTSSVENTPGSEVSSADADEVENRNREGDKILGRTVEPGSQGETTGAPSPAGFLQEWRPEKTSSVDQQEKSLSSSAAPKLDSYVASLQPYFIDEGNEHRVYLDPNSDRIVKVTHAGRWGGAKDTPVGYLERLQRLEDLAPGLDIRVQGIVHNEDGLPQIVTSMKHVAGVHPSEEVVQSKLAEMGFEKIGEGEFRDRASGQVIKDAFGANFVLTPSGALVPIDIYVEPKPAGISEFDQVEDKIIQRDLRTETDRVMQFLDSLKIDTKGQVHAFGLLPEAWNTLVDLVKLGVRGGRELRSAIEWAINRFTRENPDLKFDEDGARAYFEKEFATTGNAVDELQQAEEERAALKARSQTIPKELSARIDRLTKEISQAREGQEVPGSRSRVPGAQIPEPVKPDQSWQSLHQQVQEASQALRQAIRQYADASARPEGMTKGMANQAKALAGARFRELRDELLRHPDYVAELLTQQDEALELAKKAQTEEQRSELRSHAEAMRAELEQAPRKLVTKVYERLKKSGVIKSPAPLSETALEQPTADQRGAKIPEGAPMNIPEEWGWRQEIADIPERAKQIFTGLKRSRQMLANLASRAPNRDMVAYTKDAADNQAAIAGRQAANVVLHELNRAFGVIDINQRNGTREDALTFVIESGMSKTGLQDFLDTLDGSEHGREKWARRARTAIVFAQRNFDRLVPAAELYQKLTDAEVAVENEAGIETLHRSGGYVFHLQDLTTDWEVPDFAGGGGEGPGRPFLKERAHPTYADAIAEDIKPRTLSAVDLLQRRFTIGRKLVGYRAWIADLRRVEDPRTKLPLVTDTIKRTRFVDGKTYQEAPQGYSLAQLGGQQIALLKGYEGIFQALTKPSYWREGTFKPVLLNLAGTTKHVLLVFDSYHLGRLAFWNAVMRRGLPTYKRGVTLLDSTEADLRTMLARGEIPAEWGEALIERKRDLTRLVKAGLNVGDINDNIFNHWVEKLPVTGNFNHWLFSQYQRGAMSEGALIELDRMRKAYPNLTEAEIARRVAKDINTRFGNLKSQGWIKSKTGQDLARLVFLAPQWNESLIRSEIEAVKQIARAPLESYRQGRPAIGSMGLAVGSAALGMFLANQLLNYLTRGKPTWENPEEGLGAKISGYVPDVIGGGPGFFINPMSLPFEITHQIEKSYESTDDLTKATQRFFEGRLNVPAGAANVFWTRNDFEMGKLRNGGQVTEAVAKKLLPVPLAFSAAGRAGKQLFTRQNEEKYPGQFQQQIFQSMGLKVDRVKNDEQRIRALAQDFNRENGVVPNAEFFHGPYYALENALRLGNQREIGEALEELLKQKTAQQIRRHWIQWASAPFTGSRAREADFVDTLSPEQERAYEAARESREEIMERALDALNNAGVTP